jgi:23S rRNA pseudouridine1911/1915/1917 synthase
VHMAAIGHPLLGDPTYGRMTAARSDVLTRRNQEAVHGFRRQGLHAYLLGFRHPRSLEPMRWEADLPNDMKVLMDFLAGN